MNRFPAKMKMSPVRRTVAIGIVAAAATTFLTVLSLHPVRAQVTLNLTPAVGSGPGTAGSSIIYSGSISNLSTATIDLDGLSFTGITPVGASPFSSTITTDDSLFYSNFPATLASTGTYANNLFSIDFGANAFGPSSYTSSVAVSYTDETTGITSTTNFQNFLINVSGSSSATPEPGAATLVLGGLGLLFPSVQTQRRRKKNPEA